MLRKPSSMADFSRVGVSLHLGAAGLADPPGKFLDLSRFTLSDQQLDDGEQFVQSKGFSEECRYPDRAGRERDALVAGAHQDHGYGSKLRLGLHSLDQVQSVGNWHHQVGEHQVRVLLLQPSETILAVLRRHDALTI